VAGSLLQQDCKMMVVLKNTGRACELASVLAGASSGGGGGDGVVARRALDTHRTPPRWDEPPGRLPDGAAATPPAVGVRVGACECKDGGRALLPARLGEGWQTIMLVPGVMLPALSSMVVLTVMVVV